MASNSTASAGDADRVQRLRDQRAQLAEGDPRAADLDRQIADAEQQGGQSGQSQSGQSQQ